MTAPLNRKARPWDVPFALTLMPGLLRSGMLLIDEVDKQFAQDNARCQIQLESRGTATAAVVVVSYAAEIALKTLYVQTHPTRDPPKSHDLATLFDNLEQTTRSQAQTYLETLPVLGKREWLGEQPNLQAILEENRSNFTEWRYTPEKLAGVVASPHSLINAVQALSRLCQDLASRNQ